MATALEFNSSATKYDNKSEYVCDCGRQCTSETDLDQHKLNNCKSRLILCSFCQEPQSSSTALRDHLMSCGNKTDQCPNCRKFIRRAIFAYHYENNCANLEETDTPTPRSRISSARHSSSKSNKPESQENDVNDHDQENDSGYNSSNYRPKISNTILLSTSNKRSSLDTVICQFCNNQCEVSDYKAHQKTCLRNPTNLNNQLERTSSISNKTEFRSSVDGRRSSQDIVHIPCEICNEQIDLRYWSTHTQDCREREIRRIEARAKTINREPITEKLPCEHCEELFSVEQLKNHEILCQKNPERIARAAKLTNIQPLPTVILSNRSSKTERDPTLSSTYSSLPSSSMSAYNHSPRTKDIFDRVNDRQHSATLQNERFSSHVNMDIKRSQEIMRLCDNDASAFTITGRLPPRQHERSNDFGSQLINSSHDVPAYGTLSGILTERHLSGTQSLPHRPRSATSFDRPSSDRRPMPRRAGSPSVHSSRSQSASKASVDARGSHRSNRTKTAKHVQGNNENIFHSPRNEDQGHQPVIHQSDRSTTKKTKSKWNSSYYNPIPWK